MVRRASYSVVAARGGVRLQWGAFLLPSCVVASISRVSAGADGAMAMVVFAAGQDFPKALASSGGAKVCIGIVIGKATM